MIPNIVQGKKMYGLVNYLMGDGRANEHTQQHVIGGSETVMFLHADATNERESIGALVSTLDASHRHLEQQKERSHVWHCSLSLSERDGELSDETWQNIAQDFVRDMDFDGGVKSPCEWVAIRHGKSKNGNDHIHIAVNLVRLDGTRATTHNEKYRAQSAARNLEKKYGLEQLNTTHSREGYKRAEQERARREGRKEPHRVTLQRMVRNAATTATTEADFVRKVRESGVIIRPRFAKNNRNLVEGYSVALRPVAQEKPLWFGGGTLAKDLRISQIRQRWEETEQSQEEAKSEWNAAYEGQRAKQRSNDSFRGHEKPSLNEVLESLKNLSEQRNPDVWADISSDYAGAFGTWAQIETNPEIAAKYERIADTFGANAPHTVQPRKHFVSRPSSAYWMMLTATRNDASGRAAKIALMRQIMTSTAALHDVYRATNDLRRAQTLNHTVNQEFVEVMRHEQLSYQQVKQEQNVSTLLLDPETQQAREKAASARGNSTGFNPRNTTQNNEIHRQNISEREL